MTSRLVTRALTRDSTLAAYPGDKIVTVPGGPGDALLLESGDYMLLESGDKILLE